MKVTFHGVRGSVPAPGPGTARYGGNTSCVSVRLSDGSLLVLDAGTGLRELGKEIFHQASQQAIHILLSHTHWDHIQGLPFFGPLWSPASHLVVYPLSNEAQERFRRTITLFDEIHFPVGVNDIPAKMEFAKPDDRVWQIGSARITRIQLNHPGGSQGFRIEDDDGTSVAYLTDNELCPPGAPITTLDELARFADGVDLMIHDSQYVRADMPAKKGFGHSVIDEVLQLGAIAEPGELALYHHDPDRTDAELDEIRDRSRTWLAEQGKQTRLSIANEGLQIDLATSTRTGAAAEHE